MQKCNSFVFIVCVQRCLGNNLHRSKEHLWCYLITKQEAYHRQDKSLPKNFQIVDLQTNERWYEIKQKKGIMQQPQLKQGQFRSIQISQISYDSHEKQNRKMLRTSMWAHRTNKLMLRNLN